MATTTPNYGWPVPTSTDLVKDGATAIEALGDAVDATVFGLGVSGSWTSYTPTFTNLSIGNGTVAAAYKAIGKVMHVRVSLVFGSTTSVSGGIIFSLPATSVAYQSLFAVSPIYIEDNGVKGYFGALQLFSTTTAKVQAVGASETYTTSVDTSSTIPFTWATNDFFRTQFFYEAA